MAYWWIKYLYLVEFDDHSIRAYRSRSSVREILRSTSYKPTFCQSESDTYNWCKEANVPSVELCKTGHSVTSVRRWISDFYPQHNSDNRKIPVSNIHCHTPVFCITRSFCPLTNVLRLCLFNNKNTIFNTRRRFIVRQYTSVYIRGWSTKNTISTRTNNRVF